MKWLAGLQSPSHDGWAAAPEQWRHEDSAAGWMQQAIPRRAPVRPAPMEADYPEFQGGTPWFNPDDAMRNALDPAAWNETTGTQVGPLPPDAFLGLADIQRLQSPVTNHNLVRQGATINNNLWHRFYSR